MDKAKKIDMTKRFVMIVVGCIVNSLGVSLFLDPYHIVPGGVTGIAMVVNTVTGNVIGTGWIIIIINVPLFIVGIIFIGKLFMLTTLFSTALMSGLIELWTWTVLPHVPMLESVVLATVVGGVMFGGGIGLIFRAGSSTGGTDIIVKLLRRKFRTMKTGKISLCVDMIIISCSAFAYTDFELVLYAILSVFMYTTAFDFVLYGGNSSMLVHIITKPEHVAPLCDGLLKDLDLGATIIDAKGAYSGSDRAVIMCAVKNFVYPRLLDTIKKYDDDAFTIVSSAKEIFGEGYQKSGSDPL